jgi:uncharacterized protein YbjT (DUF2867 family)
VTSPQNSATIGEKLRHQVEEVELVILVTGATGNVGREIVKELHGAGHQIRVVSRNPAKASFPPDVEVMAGDLTDPAIMKAALDGIQKVFLIRVPGSETFPQIAKQSGVEHIVFLSSSAIEARTENAIGRMHLQTEELIRQSNIQWTFLRPGAFMSNALQWAQAIRSEGVVRAPFGDVQTAPIHPRDIAAVAVKALVSSGHEGKIYTLTGPEVLTPVEQVQTIGDVLGKQITFEEIPETVAREHMKRFAPADIVDAIFQLMREATNHPATVLPTVEEVTGQAARRFKQWVIDNADAFR